MGRSKVRVQLRRHLTISHLGENISWCSLPKWYLELTGVPGKPSSCLFYFISSSSVATMSSWCLQLSPCDLADMKYRLLQDGTSGASPAQSTRLQVNLCWDQISGWSSEILKNYMDNTEEDFILWWKIAWIFNFRHSTWQRRPLDYVGDSSDWTDPSTIVWSTPRYVSQDLHCSCGTCSSARAKGGLQNRWEQPLIKSTHLSPLIGTCSS